MSQITLGKTGLRVNKNGFGALPIQRISKEDAAALIRRAYDHGVNFFDTAISYTDSEEKLGEALKGIREKVYIATKTPAADAEGFWKDLEISLEHLQTTYIDLYQFHNPSFCPKPGDKTGLYEAMEEARRQGKVRHIGITNHRIKVAREAVDCGLYEVMQFPFSYLASEPELELVERCRQENMGYLAMKALAGGLITNARAAYAFMMQYDHVLPIWGVQRQWELDQFLAFENAVPLMDEEVLSTIEKDRKELLGEFCRGCGYCMPCPAGIEINTCARMSLLIRRSPSDAQLTPWAREMMKKIEGCLHCGRCKTRCPYGLDTPALLERNYQDYQEILAGKPL